MLWIDYDRILLEETAAKLRFHVRRESKEMNCEIFRNLSIPKEDAELICN